MSIGQFDARRAAIFDQNLCRLTCNQFQVGQPARKRPHEFLVRVAVALAARTPHGLALGAVEHAELHGRLVRGHAHYAPECIDLANDLALADAADGRIARHAPNGRHIHRYQRGLTAHARGRRRGLDARMPATDDHDVEISFHRRRILPDVVNGLIG